MDNNPRGNNPRAGLQLGDCSSHPSPRALPTRPSCSALAAWAGPRDKAVVPPSALCTVPEQLSFPPGHEAGLQAGRRAAAPQRVPLRAWRSVLRSLSAWPWSKDEWERDDP